jgi:hypothetical protein
MSLCEPCQNFMNNWEVVQEDKHCYPLSRIKAEDERSIVIFLCSVDNGCYICRRLFHESPKHLQSQLRGLNGPLPRNQRHGGCFGHGMPDPCESRDGPPVVSMEYERNDANFSICFRFGDEYGSWFCFFGLMMDRTSKVISMVPPSRAFTLRLKDPPSWIITSSSTGSKETFSKIKKWLNRCNSEHTQCLYHREQRAKDWYPTRLIHINSRIRHCGKDLGLRLVDGAHLAAGRQYATLSHRWGEADMVKLTVDNLSSWRQSIPTDILPRTFIHAF